MNMSNVKVPDVYDYIDFLDRVEDSAAGPDGLPYSAWRAAGWIGAVTLLQSGECMRARKPPPPLFNSSLSFF